MEVSVIIPVYNSEAYVKEAIESVIHQTFSSLEIIAVNDGSTDVSQKLLESILDPRLKIITQENSGAAAARNRGVQEATGRHLAFLDADDLWAPVKIQKQLQAMEESAADMIFAQVQEFLHPDVSNSKVQPRPGYSAITLLVSKEKFMKAGLFDSKWTVAEFIDWYDRAKSAGLTETMLPDVLAYRRVHPGNMDRLKRPNLKQYASVLKASLDRRRGF